MIHGCNNYFPVSPIKIGEFAVTRLMHGNLQTHSLKMKCYTSTNTMTYLYETKNQDTYMTYELKTDVWRKRKISTKKSKY